MEQKEEVIVTLRTEKVRILRHINHRWMEDMVNEWIQNECKVVHSIQYQMAFDNECGTIMHSVMIHYE